MKKQKQNDKKSQKQAKQKCIRISVRAKVTLLFAGVMALLILVVWMMNSVFLQAYYIHYKKQTLTDVYTQINQMWDEQIFEAETESERQAAWEQIMPQMIRLTDDYGVGYLIVDSTWSIYRSSKMDMMRQTQRLQEYILHQAQAERYDLGKKVVTQIVYYPDMGSYYLECWGTLDSGYPFIITVPLESIKESVTISNRFLAYIGTIGILLGSILVFLVSSRVTRPIRELSILSQKIGALDFDAKYEGKEKDEIGVLGHNMNQLSKQLEQTITELKNANLQLQQDLAHRDQLDEMRKDFISNVSHELKTPIALIQGYAEGLQDGMAEDEESRAFYCDVIADEAERMNQMVRKLLTLNQMEFGTTQLTLDRFELSEMISGLVASSNLLAKQNEITIVNEVESPLHVFGDAFQIEEVVSNYLSNAIHYCANEKRIRVYSSSEDGIVTIFVHNTGNTIPEESLSQVWDKFYKVDKARTREYGGSGIGLSIVKAIMEAHNQKYGVMNTEDGVTFYFTLEKA